MVEFGQGSCIRLKVVVFGQKWLYLGKSGCIRRKWSCSCKSGCVRARWLYSGKVVVRGQSGVYGLNGCIRAKVL